jgi:hypothetical protein
MRGKLIVGFFSLPLLTVWCAGFLEGMLRALWTVTPQPDPGIRHEGSQTVLHQGKK